MEIKRVTGIGSYDQLNEAGYLVVPVLDPEEAVSLSKTLIAKTVDLIFTKNGYKVNPENHHDLKCLVDKPLRSKLGPGADRIVWRNGSTQQPIINKTTGMIDLHFQPELLETITFNPKIVEASAKVMGIPADKLVYAWGPERVSIKAQGSPVMRKHLDCNLFNDRPNYPYRVQSLVTLSIDTCIDPDKSGTLNVLTYFHHFWEFARELFSPIRNLPGHFPKTNMGSRFMNFPSRFDSTYLRSLKYETQIYLNYLALDGNVKLLSLSEEAKREFEHHGFFDLFKECRENGILVGQDLDKLSIYLKEMKWQSIKVQPGDMIFWHQHLPHRSMPNKSLIPRVVAYTNLYPAGPDWNSSFQRKWVARQFQRAESYYVKNANALTNDNTSTHMITNIEEHQDFEDTKQLETIAKLSLTSDFRKKLSGQLNI